MPIGCGRLGVQLPSPKRTTVDWVAAGRSRRCRTFLRVGLGIALCERISGPLLLSAALDVLALHSEQCERERRAAVMGPQRPATLAAPHTRTFAILARIADADAASAAADACRCASKVDNTGCAVRAGGPAARSNVCCTTSFAERSSSSRNMCSRCRTAVA